MTFMFNSFFFYFFQSTMNFIQLNFIFYFSVSEFLFVLFKSISTIFRHYLIFLPVIPIFFLSKSSFYYYMYFEVVLIPNLVCAFLLTVFFSWLMTIFCQIFICQNKKILDFVWVSYKDFRSNYFLWRIYFFLYWISKLFISYHSHLLPFILKQSGMLVKHWCIYQPLWLAWS